MSDNSMLNDEQLHDLVRALKKYGIESPDLLSELTDHYAGEIESKMMKGATFQEALKEFRSENSWLKLRKLEFKHAQIQSGSFTRSLGLFMREMFFGPRFWIAYPTLAFIYYCVSLPFGAGEPIFYFVQGCSIGVAAGILIFVIARRRSKFRQFGPLITMSLMLIYLSVYLPFTGLVPEYHPIFTGFAFSNVASMVYYSFWVFLLIFTVRYFLKLRRDTQDIPELYSK
jgi:hypothetical protein